MNSHSRSRWRGSSDADGSSSSSAAGSDSSPMAMLTRCWLPPDSRPTSSSARSLQARLHQHALRPPPRGRRPAPAGRTAAGSPRPRASSTAPAAAGPSRSPRCAAGLAVVGREHPGEDREQRRLARTVRTDHRDQLTRARLEAHRASAPPRAEALGQPAGREGDTPLVRCGRGRHSAAGYLGSPRPRATASARRRPAGRETCRTCGSRRRRVREARRSQGSGPDRAATSLRRES